MTQMFSAGALTLNSALNTLGVNGPSFHIVLGSGFKDALASGIPSSFKVRGELPFTEVPGLFPSTAPGHAGKYVIVEHQASKRVGFIQVGRLHGYEGLTPKEVVRTVMFTRELGATEYFLTNAAGGIDAHHVPGDAMIITDHINLTGLSPLTGENPRDPKGKEWGPRFPDLTNLYLKEWRKPLMEALKNNHIRVHEGVYVGVPGPAFETPAEIRFFRNGGANAVGMSTIWEALALKHSGAKVGALSLISNVAAGLTAPGPNGDLEELDHFAILDACKNSSTGILRSILQTLEKSYGI